MAKPLYLCLISLLCFSCDPPAEEKVMEEMPVVSQEAVPYEQNNEDQDGIAPEEEPTEVVLEADASEWIIYEGTIPCADCQGILMRLKLQNKPGQDDNSYELSETYQGTKDGNRVYQSRGSYQISYGYANDPSVILITLQGLDNVKRVFYQENSQALTLLDKEGRKIISQQNYTLKKL